MGESVAIDTTTRPHAVPALQIVVLAALAGTGTLATNILLPSLPEMAVSLNVTTAAVTSAITIFLAVFAFGQLLVGPVSDRYGRRWPVLIGFFVFFAGSVCCGLAADLPTLLTGRVIQAAGACATSVLSRAIARDLFSGAVLARAMALILIAMAVAPGLSPLLGGALERYFSWRSEFVLLAAFSALGAIAYCSVLGETHKSTRIQLNPLSITRTYLDLMLDREFVVPAAVVSITMGGMFAMFSAAPRVLIEALHLSPIELGLSFAGTLPIVFVAGLSATKLARRGLERPMRWALLVAAIGAATILLVSIFSPSFSPFLAAMSVFLLGMGVITPLGTAQALSPFGERAGAASALLGFWQMLNAAIGVWLTSIIADNAMFALGVVLTIFCLIAGGLYPLRAKSKLAA
jgi:MFS transporter, DHA1 family, multidrug resistance protein